MSDTWAHGLQTGWSEHQQEVTLSHSPNVALQLASLSNFDIGILTGRHRLRHRRRQLHRVPEPHVIRRRVLLLLVRLQVELGQPGRPLGGQQ